MAPKRVVELYVTYEDGTTEFFECEDGYYIQRTNFDAIRDGHGKTRKDRARWIEHEVHWKSNKEPVRAT